jgi:hypothetical protein
LELPGIPPDKVDNTPTPQERLMQMVSSIQVPEEPYFVDAHDIQAQNALMTHAKVFVFAEYWGVDRLKELSLRRLGTSLEDLGSLTDDEVDKFVALMEYCYEEPRPHELTKLVSLYSASRVKEFWKSQEFREVVKRYNELAVALIGDMIDPNKEGD